MDRNALKEWLKRFPFQSNSQAIDTLKGKIERDVKELKSLSVKIR